MMKKFMALCLVLALTVSALAGCSGGAVSEDEKAIIAAADKAVAEKTGKTVVSADMKYDVGKTLDEYVADEVEAELGTLPAESDDIMYVSALLQKDPENDNQIISYAASYNTQTKEVKVLVTNPK